MSDCLLIQQANSVHAYLLNLTIRDHIDYCQTHDIDYWPIYGSALTGKDKDRHAYWNKVSLLRKALDAGYEQVIWLDSDCYIADPSIDIRTGCSPNSVGLVRHAKGEWPEGKECYDHWNAGAIYFGNGPCSSRLINIWWNSPDDGHCWHDQHALNAHAIPGFEKLMRKPAPIHQLGYEWNAVPFKEFDHPSPIVRAWHGWSYDLEVRHKAMEEYIRENKMRRMLDGCSVEEAMQKAEFCVNNGNFPAAIQFFQRAEELGATGAMFYAQFGKAHWALKDHESAKVKYNRALEFDPESGPLLQCISSCCDFLGEHEENRSAICAALKHSPNWPALMHNKMLFDLRDGNWIEGFDEMKWQFLMHERIARCPGPEWDGSYAPSKTIFVWAEQGIGDTIMLSRYVPELALCHVRNVLFEVQPPLYELFKYQQWPRIEVICRNPEAGVPWKYDAHVGTFTLPALCGTTPENVIAKPYLTAPDVFRKKWHDRIFDEENPNALNVGFSWAGSAGHGNNHHRNTEARYFDRLVGAIGTRWYSLQRDIQIPQEVIDSTPEVEWIGEEFEDMADMAGCLVNLDLVITIDSAVAHLCGALGVPCWMLISKSSDWRWLLDREDTVWYESVRLFRQKELDDWEEVFERVGLALKEKINA